MKKLLSKIGDFFSGIFACILAIFLGICLVIMLPLDYIKYKRSHYYKIKRKRYKLFAGTGVYFELFNEISKNNLPIKYIYNPNNDSLECGWFVFVNTLIIPNVLSFEYDEESKEWNYCCEPDDDGNETRSIMSLDEYMDTEIQEANDLAGETICNKAIVLIDADFVGNAELADQDDRFLVYNDSRIEALINYCNKNLH